MPISEFLLNSSSLDLLTLTDILGISGLSKKYPEIAILSLNIKRSISPGGSVDRNRIRELATATIDLSLDIKALLDHTSELAVRKTGRADEPEKDLNFETDHLSFSFQGFHDIDMDFLSHLTDAAHEANRSLTAKTGHGKDFLGWMGLPSKDVSDVHEISKEIRESSDAVVFIGIGGSYLGARAVISALLPESSNLLAGESGNPEVYFAGQNLSTSYLSNLLRLLKMKRVTLVPISKSGTTTEPAVAFRILRKELSKSGNNPQIVAITDRSEGALKKLARSNGWKTLIIPDDVGGRYSVLSPVGLLPIAVAGIDIDGLLGGARKISELFKNTPESGINPAVAYAIYRQAHHIFGRDIEIVSCWSPSLTQIGEWWKQLFGESEGKDGKGIFVSSTTFTTDLHSVGQLIQDGKRNFIETFLAVEKENPGLTVEKDSENLDNLNYLAGKSPDYINHSAEKGTLAAHLFGNVPIIIIKMGRLDPECTGALLYFWEYACGLSAYIQGVNPFTQPGVEEYKKRMFKLLGKP